jgi:catechol 2,3-dioxygenase-like lactoylglutathione lyase family enzyme
MRLNQITVPAKDIEASLIWYQMLGFHLIVDSDHYKRLLAPEGGTTLSLMQVEEAGVGSAPKIYLECDSQQALQAQYAKLAGQGVAFQHPPQDQTWLWREAWTTDPHGNAICLYTAGKNRLHPPWKVD